MMDVNVHSNAGKEAKVTIISKEVGFCPEIIVVGL